METTHFASPVIKTLIPFITKKTSVSLLSLTITEEFVRFINEWDLYSDFNTASNFFSSDFNRRIMLITDQLSTQQVSNASDKYIIETTLLDLLDSTSNWKIENRYYEDMVDVIFTLVAKHTMFTTGRMFPPIAQSYFDDDNNLQSLWRINPPLPRSKLELSCFKDLYYILCTNHWGMLTTSSYRRFYTDKEYLTLFNKKSILDKIKCAWYLFYETGSMIIRKKTIK